MIGSTNAVKLINTYDLTVTTSWTVIQSLGYGENATITSQLVDYNDKTIKYSQSIRLNKIPTDNLDFFWTFNNVKTGKYVLTDTIESDVFTKTVYINENAIITSPMEFSSASLTVIYPPNTKWYLTNGATTLTPDKTSSGSYTFSLEQKGVWNIYYQGNYWDSINISKSGESYTCHIGYLYYSGNEETPQTGGWVTSGTTNIVKGVNSITLGKTSGTVGKAIYSATTNNKIDLTNYNTIFIHTVQQRNSHLTNTISGLQTIADSPVLINLKDENTTTNAITDKQYQLDISSLTDKYQIQVFTQNKTTSGYYFYVEFDKIWLE